MDLDSYFQRIGWQRGRETSVEVLKGIHLAHTSRIPYENLDILLGRGISLEPSAIERKIVREGRGGYCFEQNALMALVLEQLGFRVTRLAARVRLLSTGLTPRTHQILLVECEARRWLVDVGFGGWGLLEPIPLEAGGRIRQGVWDVRLDGEGDYWVMRCPQSPMGEDQYTFTLEPQFPIDYVLANHYCATHPESRFVRTLTAQKASLEKRYVLRNLDLTVTDEHGSRTMPIQPGELLEVLESRFGLYFPPGTIFRTSTGAINA